MKLQDVRGLHIQQLYNQMADNGFSAKTIKNVAIVLHRSFDVAKKQSLLLVNPCEGAKPPKVKRPEISPLSDGDIPRFLAAINDSPMRNAYALCLFAGLREGECLGLSWKQGDFQQGKITVSQQLQHRQRSGHQVCPGTDGSRHFQLHFGCLRPCFGADAAGHGRPDAGVLRRLRGRQAEEAVRGMIRGRNNPDKAETLKPQRFQGFKLEPVNTIDAI